MMQRAKFLFDLNGFIVVRNVLSKEELAAAHAAIDAHEWHERKGAVRNSKDHTPFAGNMSTGRLDMAGMLGWSPEQREVFRSMLVHPKIVPYLHMLVGEGYRLDHSPLVIGQNHGSEGFSLHGGNLTKDGNFVPELQYVCKHGSIYNTLLAVSYQLTDHNPGDGGYCVLRGSHKMNFPPSAEMMNGEDQEFFSTYVEQPATKAGDVVIFSEATIHGAIPWTPNDRQRRIALFRFSPCHLAFARGYSNPKWPDSFTEGMSDAQLAVMQPPYLMMYDRQYLNDDGTLGTEDRGRSQKKKDFDLEVFGTKYY